MSLQTNGLNLNQEYILETEIRDQVIEDGNTLKLFSSDLEVAKKFDGSKLSSRDKLILQWAPLSINVARQFYQTGIPIDDLVQYGIIGLIRAVDQFDPNHNSKATFKTYAYKAIKNEIIVGLQNEVAITKIPRYISSYISEFIKHYWDFYQTHREAPLPEHIFTEIGVVNKEIQEGITNILAMRFPLILEEYDEVFDAYTYELISDEGSIFFIDTDMVYYSLRGMLEELRSNDVITSAAFERTCLHLLYDMPYSRISELESKRSGVDITRSAVAKSVKNVKNILILNRMHELIELLR